MDRLSEQYRVVTLDFPGHGLTGAVPAATYSTEAYIDVVKSVLQNLGITRFVLAGNSMGGGVAWRYALAHPEQIQGLVLIDSAGLAEWFRENRGGSSVLAFRLLSQGWFRAISQKLDPWYMTVQGLEAAYNNSPVIDDALIMRYYELNLREGTRGATMARFGQLRSQTSYSLADITAPTLIMWGKEDSLIPFAHAGKFEAAIPDTSTAYYDNVGHIPMEEIPEKSVTDLIQFLERVTVQTTTQSEAPGEG